MPVILAKSAGFCYGVKRAVALAEQTAGEDGGCWMLGDLIHNAHVVEDLRRRGLALSCGARLILTCLDRGLYPSWDAANLESVALARRLGYRPAGPYDAWELYCPPQTQKDGEALSPPENPNNP